MTQVPLHLVAQWRDGRVESVEAINARPMAAGLLKGKSPEEAAQMAGVLFSLCGVAQRHAVLAACQAARGEAYAVDVETERALAIEAAQLHMWRALLDWPNLFGMAPVRDRFGLLHRALSQVRDKASAFEVGGHVLNLVGNELLSGFFVTMREPRNLTEFSATCSRAGTVGKILSQLIDAGASDPLEETVPLLPSLRASDLIEALPNGWPDEDFCRAPQLAGQVYETGPLARQVSNPLVARLITHRHRIAARLFARLVDLSDCASRMRYPLPTDMPPMIDAASMGDGVGLARVETARGVLLHAVRLEGDMIADYAVVAPTEWNFRPGGVFEHEGAGWDAPDPAYARWRIQALALALDPCVNFEVSVKTDEEVAHA
ncbi:hypothetical protein [Nitrogeniibacter aestuarii]|uniref:hypothetical protein n=1 Tax=Nitrogeniibacter aestuarii TaxID=2815343 RepID=UPI001D12D1F7|nr:hypothetical protein [Nitrogeniibacter aestuarii]